MTALQHSCLSAGDLGQGKSGGANNVISGRRANQDLKSTWLMRLTLDSGALICRLACLGER